MVLNNTEDRFAQEFGIKVLLPACVLPPHMLSYHNCGREKRCAPSAGQWNMMISEACVSLVEGLYHKNLPPDTFVAVQKRHHTRLFPEIHGKRDMAEKSGSIRTETVVVSSGKPVGQYITNPLSSSSDIGKNDIQIFIKLLDFPTFPMCFDLNCEIKTIVTSAQHKVGVYLMDPKIEYSSRKAYFEDTLSSLRAVNNTTLIISQRLRGGLDTIALIQYAVSLGDALFDTVTLPPELHYPDMERFYISLASDGMNLYDLMFALLDSYHLQNLCLGTFGPEDILYDRTDRILIFTDNVEIALYTLEGYWNNLGSTGNVFAAIFKYDERKVRSALPGIHTTGLHGRLPHLVELLVEDLTVVVRTSQDDESDVTSRKYFRRHVVQMPLAAQLSFYLTFDLHIDYLGGCSSIQTYIGSCVLEKSWITPQLRSSAIGTMTTLDNYNGMLVGSQWSCTRNLLSHAKDNLLLKFSEKQAVAFINLVFRRLFRNVLLKATFKIIQVDWDQPQVAKRTMVYAPKITNQPEPGGQLLVSNTFTFSELLPSRCKTIQIR